MMYYSKPKYSFIIYEEIASVAKKLKKNRTLQVMKKSLQFNHLESGKDPTSLLSKI